MSHLGVVGRRVIFELTLFVTHLAFVFLTNLVFVLQFSYVCFCLNLLWFFIGILNPGSIKIERGMKNYFWSLVLRFFGLMGSSLVPGEGLR